jgi:hypothetical protein
MDWSEHVYYDETSPSCLRRAKDVHLRNRLLCSKGDVAGSIGSGGYYEVRICNKLYYVHRIIWEILNNSEIPYGLEVDHINRDRLCNIGSNLRVVTRKENSQNHTIRSDNTSGVTGVGITDSGHNLYWTARCCVNGENIQKHFSIEKMGYDGAFQAAVECRKQMLDDMNAVGCSYTETHGI